MISAAALIITFLLYFKRPLQLILRVAVILLILLLITNITIRVDTEVAQKDPIVLVDYSMSMEAHQPDILKYLTNIDFPHDLYYSKDSLITKTQPQDPGTYTDLKGAIEQARTYDPASIVLISDGNHNFGNSPLSSVRELDIPVHTYGIGAEKIRDAKMIDADCPKYAYQGDSVNIQATVETSGFATGMADLVLQSPKGARIKVQNLPLSDVLARNTISFTYFAAEPGNVQLELRILPQSNEVSYENNSYSFSLNILQDKIKVLYYTDHISFNTKFILRSLQTETNVALMPITRLGSTSYQNIAQGNELNRLPDLAEFDLLIFDNADLDRLPWRNTLDMISAGTGITLSGTLSGINAAWLEVLPINLARGTLHGTYKLDIIEPFSVLVDNNPPPVKNINRVVAAKQDAVIIARTGNLPLIGYRAHGNGKVFQICVVDLGPWHFLRSGLKGDTFLQILLGDLIRFLSPLGEYQRLVVSTMETDYALGQTVRLKLQSYDPNFRRVGGGDFYLVAEEKKIPFYETRMGHYESSFIAEMIGTHKVFAQGELHGERLRSDSLMISVSSRSPENERRLNRELLERIASASGGEFHDLEDIKNISVPERKPKKETRLLGFDSPVTYLVMLLLLVVDWITRRRRGIT